MILTIHIISAIISLLFVSYTALVPSKFKIGIALLLTFATIVSGVVLVFNNPAYLGKACISGLVYIGSVLALSAVARKRLYSHSFSERL